MRDLHGVKGMLRVMESNPDTIATPDLAVNSKNKALFLNTGDSSGMGAAENPLDNREWLNNFGIQEPQPRGSLRGARINPEGV
jgi:hypothetical protein